MPPLRPIGSPPTVPQTSSNTSSTSTLKPASEVTSSKQIVQAMVEVQRARVRGLMDTPAQWRDQLVLHVVPSADAQEVIRNARAASPALAAMEGPFPHPVDRNAYTFRPTGLDSSRLSSDPEQRAEQVSTLVGEKLGVGSHVSATTDRRFANIGTQRNEAGDWVVALHRSSASQMGPGVSPLTAKELPELLRKKGLEGGKTISDGVVELHGVKVVLTPKDPHPSARGVDERTGNRSLFRDLFSDFSSSRK
jgi:hypothetical protein